MIRVEERIEVDSLGFSVERVGLASTRIAWGSIQLVEAFKQDILTVDLLCLRFDLDGESIVVHEEQPGWQELVNVLPEKLAGFPPFMQWLGGVALPPFAENRVRLFASQS